MSPAELILKLDIDVRSHSVFESTLNSAIVSYRIVWATIVIIFTVVLDSYRIQESRS